MGLLDGKLALVSGVTNRTSIAWGIAEALHRHGARIVLTCLEGNLRRVRKLGPLVQAEGIIPCDVRNEGEIEGLFARVGELYQGKLDILVHSLAYADFADLGEAFLQLRREGWHTAIDVSAYSFVSMTRQAFPLMKASGGGSIMTLTYAGGEVVAPGYNVMAVAKAALEISVLYLAYELGPEKIRVNALSPGPIATPSAVVVEDFAAALQRYEIRSPLLRAITLEDIGGTAVYLASELSSGVTGTILKVDGGMHCVAPFADVHKAVRRSEKKEHGV